LLLTGAALFVAALGGGMLNDKVIPTPEWGGPFSLLAVPLVIGMIGAALVLAFWREEESRRFLLPPSSFFLLFAVWSVLSLIRSGYLHASLTVLAILAAAIALGAVIVQAARRPKAAFALVVALVAIASVVAGIGINEYIRNWREGNALWRVFATFTVPNFLAGFLMMTVPVTAALFLAVRERYLTLLSGFALLLQAMCVLLTGSRFGLLTLVFTLVVFAILAWRSGALTGAARQRAFIVLGLVAAAALIGGRPVLKRLFSVGSESYSNQFRLYTWRGVTRMAQLNPFLGTGIGTFETAYPPYAEVGYTQHAHNSFIQLAGEIGFPGVMFLLIGLAGILAAGTAALRTTEGAKGRGEAEVTENEEGSAAADTSILDTTNGRHASKRTRRRHAEKKDTSHPSVPPSPLLLAGLLAAIAGAVAHNLFDSDLYVPANALTLAAICGLILALTPHPITRSPNHPITRYLAMVVALPLVGHALLTAGGRMQAYNAALAIRAGRGAEALDGYQAAAGFERWNPEHYLSLATLYEASNQPEKARSALEGAVRVAPIGKTFYRFGRLLLRIGEKAQAVRMFERARQLEPGNLQNLLALAEAYKAAGRSADAESVYAHMIRLYRSPFGAVRPVPELVDWEFGVAYLGLAEAAIERGDREGAAANLEQGAGILGEFWRSRGLQIFRIRIRPDVLQNAMLRYDWALEQWIRALQDLGRPQEAAAIEERRAKFRAEREKE